MRKRLQAQQLSEKQEFKLQFSSWIDESHFWVEKECKWCGQIALNMPSKNICMQNPKILEIIQQAAKKYSNYESF